MDSDRFDTLSRSLATVGTRRGLMRLLGALPLVGVLMAVLDDEPAGAKRRGKAKRHRKTQRRRADQRERVHEQKKKHQKHNENKKRKKKKKDKAASPLPPPPPPEPGCVPQSMAQTCAGRCGTVPNNCDALVDCGSCACGAACPACQTCNAATGICETNPSFVTLACGLPGQVCQAEGDCVCDDTSCADGQRCNGIVCICDDESCPTGCCDGNRTCRINDDAACGTGGGGCTRCSGTGVTCGGGGTPGQCGCTSQGCGNQTCGATADNCGQPITCGGCTGCCEGNTCRDGTNREACGSAGEVCQPCSGVCGGAGGVCSPCDSILAPCPGGLCCVAGECVASCPTCQTCSGGTCASDSGQNRSACQLSGGGGTGVCCNGTCCAGCCDATAEHGVCGPCLAFVTSTASTGNLGGLAGADLICQRRAEAGSLWGSYKAWLSSAFGSPSSRFRCTSESCSAMGYVDASVDERVIASNWQTLTDGTLENPIAFTELRGATTTPVWTNTRPNGTPIGVGIVGSCQNWTSQTVGGSGGNLGLPEAVDEFWTDATFNSCPNLCSLYCFQQA